MSIFIKTLYLCIIIFLITGNFLFGGSFFVGICGPSGAGKTLMAEFIKKKIGAANVAVINMDDYYKPKSQFSKLPINFDSPDAIDFDLLIEHLSRLKQGVSINSPRYDFIFDDRRTESRLINPLKVVVVEGFLLFILPRLRELFDVKIFLDLDLDVQLARQVVRDIEQRGRELKQVLNNYFLSVKPTALQWIYPYRRYADIVLSTNYDNDGASTSAVAFIESAMHRTGK